MSFSKSLSQFVVAALSALIVFPAGAATRSGDSLDEVIKTHSNAVIATPGGLVSEPATLNLLLMHCFTIWLQATPEDHMKRVIAQGDMRPMAGNKEAMEDLRRILAGRVDFYTKADISFDTSGRVLAEAYLDLRSKVLLHHVPAAVEVTSQ